MKCSQCHAENGDASSKFCTSCGASMLPTCKACGSKIPQGARFCPACANPVTPQLVKTSDIAQAPLPAKQMISSPPPLAAGRSIAQTAIKSNAMSSRFARFWAKGESGPFSCWKFSNSSQEEAQNLANERILQIAEKFRKEKIVPQKYLYSDQRLREPVIQEIHNAVISRNAYGCLVLNTADIMFVDVDFPETKPSGILKSFFKSPAIDVQEATLAKIEYWTAQHSGWGWRVYRTFAGLRLLATNGVFAPESTDVHSIFEGLGADPLYQVLCKVQKCFRARLTPKPWRCDMPAPSSRWPWASDEEANKFDNWRQLYEQNSKNFATCRLIKIIGNPAIHPSVQPIIELHDQFTLVGTDLPLA